MKFAICNEAFPPWPEERSLAFARQCGYTGVEFAPYTMGKDILTDVRYLPASDRVAMRQAAEAAGLEVVGLHWLFHKTAGFHLTSPDAGIRRNTATYLTHLALLCRDLGGSIMVLGSPKQRDLLPGVSHDQGMAYACEVLQAVMPLLEDLSITLAIEPLGPRETNFLNTAADGARLVEMVGSPACRLHLDCKAMSTEKEPIPVLLKQHAKILAHFHANDPNGRGPGMGSLDFRPILATLLEIDYQGWVSVEVFDHEPPPEVMLRESIDNLRASLPTAAAEGASNNPGAATAHGPA
jgi:sugar phosphate isomerase/epimerase